MSKENDDLDFLADDYDQPSQSPRTTSTRRLSTRPRVVLKKTSNSSSNSTSGRRDSINSNDELTLDQIQSPPSSSSSATTSPQSISSPPEPTSINPTRSGSSKIIIGSKIQKPINNNNSTTTNKPSLITESSSKVQTKKFMSNLLKSVQTTQNNSSQPSSPTNESQQQQQLNGSGGVATATTANANNSEGIVIDEAEEKRRDFDELMMKSSKRQQQQLFSDNDKKQITLDKLESLMQTLDRHDRVPLLDENINIVDLYSSDPSQIDAKQGIIKSNPPLFQKHDQPLDIDLFEEITSFSTIQRRYLSQDEMVKGDFKTSHEFQLKPTVGNLSSAVDEVREFVKKEKERHQIMMGGEEKSTQNESSSSLTGGGVPGASSSSSDLKSNLEKQVEHESHMEKAKKIFRKIEYRHVFKDLVNRLVMEKIGIPTILRVNSKFIAVGTSNGLIVLYHRKTENRLAILGSIQNEEITNLSGGKVVRPIQVTALDFGSKMTLPYEEFSAKSEQDLLMLYYRISTDQDDYTVNATTGGDKQQDEENIEVLSQTSRVLVSGHSDGSINIWNLSTFKPVKPLKGYFTKPVQKIVNLHKTSKQYNAIEFLAVDTSGRMKLFNVRKIMFAYYVDVQPILWANIPKEMTSFKSTNNLESENGESNSSQLIASSMTPEQQLKMKELEKRQQQEKILSTFSEFQVLPKSEGRHPLDRFVLAAVATESEVTIHSVKPSSRQIATLYNNSVLDMASGAASSAGSFMRKKITPKIAWKASQMVDGDHRGLTVSLNDQTNPYLAVAWGNRIAFYHVEVQQPSSFFNFMFGGNSNSASTNGQANINGTQNGSSQNGNSNANTPNGSSNMNVNMGGSDLPNIYFASEMFVPFNIEHIHWLTDDLFIVLDSKQSKMLLIDRKLESSTNWIEEVNCKDLMLDYISDPMMNIPNNLKKKYGLQYGGGFTRGSFDVSAFQYIEILRHSSITPQSLKHSMYNSSDSDDTVSIPSTTHSFASEMYRASYGGGGIVTVKHRSPTIYMLGASELRAMRCLSWDERVVALQTIGEYEEALNMSVEMFNDPTSIGALVGLPNKEEIQRHQAVSALISSILVDYRDTKLHQLQLDNGLTHQKVESLVQVARNCLQRAIEINDIELIEGTFMSFEHYGCEHIFFQLLVEELILNGALSRMMTIDSKKASYDFIQSQFMKIKDLYTSDADPEKGEKGLIDLSRYIKYHNNIDNEIAYDSSSIHPLSPKVRFERLESIILNLDISKLQIEYEIFLELNEKCKRYNLYRMHIYSNCVLNSDFITPVRDYLEDITISDLSTVETKEKADAILEYFKNIVTKGTIFTDAYHITDVEVLKKVKRLIVDFLFEQTRVVRMSSNSQEKHKNNGIAMLNLEKLIKYNPKETFDVLKLYFEEIAVEGSTVTSPFYTTFPRPIKNPLTKEEKGSILEEFIVTSFADCVNEGTGSNMSLRKWVPKLNREELIEAMKSYILDPPQGELDIEIDSPTFTLREKKYLYEFLGEMIARNILAEDKGQIKRIYTHLCHDNVFTSDETKELLKQFKEHEKASTETKKGKSLHLTEQARQESVERIMKQTSYLNERKEYLIKEYDFKRHRQNILMKILEKLESSNEQTISTILVRLIDYAQENNCYQAAVYLNRKKKDYKAVIKNYIDDLKLKKAIGHSQLDTPVFSYISELANDSEVITISIHDAILDHFLDLMKADSEEMTLLIVKYFPTLHPQVLNTLITSSIKHIEDERLLFNYLSKIINIYEGNNDLIDVKANTSSSTMSQFFTSMTRTKIDVDMELQYQYIRLLCKFEPHKVCDWLQTHQFPGEKAEEILEYCRNIPDAVSFLLERNGEVMEALNIVLKNISRETSILEETLSNISKKFDPENIRFSKYRHVKDIKERTRLQKGVTYTDAEEQAEQKGIKFFNVERILGLVDLEEIPLDVYLEARRKVLDGRGLLPNTSNVDKDDASVHSVNPLHYGLDEEFIGRGSIFLQVEDLPESKKIRKELAVAISMCKRNTTRKTVDEKQVKQLWFKLLDQFNLPFSEYFKSYKLGIEDSSVSMKRDDEGGEGERLQANEETDVEQLKSKIEKTREARKTKENELLEKEKELSECVDEEERKGLQKTVENSKKYIAQQIKKEKTIQKQIQDIRDKSKMEKEKSNQMHNLAKLWLQLLEFKLLRVVVLSAIGSLPIPEILKKLTKENAKSDFSMYRQILLHLLDKYKYDLKLLQNANNVVEEDTFTLSKKFTDRLMRGLCPTVPKCMLTDTLLTPEVDDNEDEEKTNSKKGRREKKFDVIRLFDTGYGYRLSALGNVTRCPTTTTSVKKKKFEVEKTKSITEVKKITNELSRLSQVESQVKKKPTMKLYRTALKESQMVRSSTKKAGSLDLVFSGLDRPLLPPIAEELTNMVPNLFTTTTSRDISASNVETNVENSIVFEGRYVSQEQIIDSLLDNAIQF
ncbi:hypothetical protein NAEGRDRAFT_82025 [Naegleria gruberi]|uniref:Vacuolar protein sorting-associated protein 8 central domain-containing protein n=1 Tax=Naegleria gruberi TaxID=5762 RepID=D2W1F7_NAEGR|nr:uncharacterized protein NAEGRDRAFT_82025 [Naegleria gruberi]EFC37038.1 hypothetical protein NAEGRDRAFT_82025 [Naegleria gruberi]|eukprot:XP_002669782.1 hypothetical protein NAEGRDRAFT_82025 [Naegleria gruberi strain NEG-M]